MSHDRWFLARVAPPVLYVDGSGATRLHHGELADLMKDVSAEREAARLAEQRARREASRPSAPAAATTPAPQQEQKQRARLTPWQEKELGEVEERIGALEERIGELDEELVSPELYAAGADPGRARALQSERETAQTSREELMNRWEELEALRR